MMSGFGLGDSPSWRKPVRIVVVGEKGTRKSSLIMAAVTDHYHPDPNIPPLLPYTNLPSKWCSEGVPVTLIDTSSRPEDMGDVLKEVKEADAIVLTFALDRPQTLDCLSEYWLPLFRQLEVRVPIVVAGYRVIKEEHNPINIEEITTPITQQYREIEKCIEWSAQMLYDVSWLAQAVFVEAQRAAMHPIGPLYDQETSSLKPRYVAALKRIFELYARDNGYILNEDGLNDINFRCFDIPLRASQIRALIEYAQEQCPLGVKGNGLTIDGFFVIITKCIKDRRNKMLWTMLRTFGYNNDLRLADEMIPYSSFKCKPDQSVELTDEAIRMLRRVYRRYDEVGDNNNLESLFETAPESPWNEAPYKDAAEKTSNGGLSLEAYLSLWSLMTLLDPARSLEYFMYICHPDDLSSAVRVTRRRELDRKEKISGRKVVQCLVFGPKNAGKSALLNGFIGRPYDDDKTNESAEERYAVNMISVTGDTKKTLVMKEIQYQEDGLLLSDEALASCDVAIFVYDSSDESSWKRATDLLGEVATISEDSGFEFPCLMVAAKTDLDSFPMAIQESTRAAKDLRIEAPIPFSSKLGDFGNLFRKILTAAEHPHLCIPETETKKQRSRNLINAVSIGTAAFIIGVASFRLYASRKQS